MSTATTLCLFYTFATTIAPLFISLLSSSSQAISLSPPDSQALSPASTTARYFNRTASPVLRAAERRVHRLQSVFVCHAIRGGASCGVRQPARLARAARRLASVARRERVGLGLGSLPYKTSVVEPLVGPVRGTILDMHYYTGSGAVIMRDYIVPAVKCGALPGVRVVVPTAWLRKNPDDGKPVTAWYTVPSARFLDDFRRDEILAAAGNVSATLDIAAATLGVPRAAAGVIGTSQGGSMAIVVYLRHLVSAAVSVVGFFPDQDAYPSHMTALSKDRRIKLLASKIDSLVPFERVRQAVAKLEQLGRKVQLETIEGAHVTTTARRRADYADAYDWLRKEMDVEVKKPAGWRKGECINVEPVVWDLK